MASIPPLTPLEGAGPSSGRRLSDALAACSREELLRYVDTLERRALHDPLTGLANRALLEDRLQQTVALSRRNRAPFALLVCDLDGFKEVNDRYGHDVGDAVLRKVADRLQGLLRASDSVARLGGDEFAVVLPHTDRAGADIVVDKITAALDQPMRVGGRSVTVGASVGVSMFPDDATDAAALARRADTQMYGAKGRRRHAPLRRLTRALALGAVFVLGAFAFASPRGSIGTPDPVEPAEPRPPIAAPQVPLRQEPLVQAAPAGVAARGGATRSSVRVLGDVVLASAPDDGSEEDGDGVRIVRLRPRSLGDSGGGGGSDDDGPKSQGKAKGQGKGGGDDEDDRSRGGSKGGGKDKDDD